jgi:hypothetical protein
LWPGASESKLSCKAQNIFLLAPPGATPEVLKSKLIKEDHFLFACTTKMS